MDLFKSNTHKNTHVKSIDLPHIKRIWPRNKKTVLINCKKDMRQREYKQLIQGLVS